jgi:hypothetical protein
VKNGESRRCVTTLRDSSDIPMEQGYQMLEIIRNVKSETDLEWHQRRTEEHLDRISAKLQCSSVCLSGEEKLNTSLFEVKSSSSTIKSHQGSNF